MCDGLGMRCEGVRCAWEEINVRRWREHYQS